MENHDPLQQLCRVLQSHWQHAAQQASQVHAYLGTRLQRLSAASAKSHRSMQRRKPMFASLSMADNFPSQGRGGADVDEEIPQDADRKSKKRRKAHKKAEKLRQELEKLSPKDRVGLARNAAITGVSAREVEFEGRTVTVGELIQEVQAEQEQLGPTARPIPKYDSVRRGVRQVPGHELRPGAPKMQLRSEEEAQLPLDMLGRGAIWTPRPLLGYAFGGVRNAGIGLYGRCENLKAMLEDRWAGEHPSEVLRNEDYYEDVINSAPATELTMIAVPSRDIPLPVIREQVEDRMACALNDRLGSEVSPETLATLVQLGAAINKEHLAKTGIIKGNSLLADTNVIVSTCPDGAFTVEAIKPFKQLKDRQSVFLCRCADPALTHALFSMVLGPRPICLETKAAVGHGVLYVTKGHKFGTNPYRPRQLPMTSDKTQPTFQELLNDKQAGPVRQSFQVDDDDDEPSKKPYLSHIRHGLRKQRKQLS